MVKWYKGIIKYSDFCLIDVLFFKRQFIEKYVERLISEY